MSAAATTTEKTPEWMLLLEKKKNRPHRLAHEIGAGAPCLTCGEGCPGLDLHFWRKLCRNCKCKKEEHDVKDDDGYEQFEILLGAGGKRKKPGAVLKIKVPDVSSDANLRNKNGVPFDWVPPNVTDDVAAEYMQQMPAAKLPISGSDGALYRRQQLERQMPLHDFDAGRCHNLTPQEIEELQKYLDNLKTNVVGQGRVTKVPVLYAEQRHPYKAPTHEQISSRPNATIPSSRSYQSFPLPPFPNKYNTGLRQFEPPLENDLDFDIPPPLPTTNPPDFQGANFKTPASFMPSTGSLLSSQYSQDIARSTDNKVQYPNVAKPYGSTVTPHQGSLSSHKYSKSSTFSSAVPNVDPRFTHPLNADGLSSAFPQNAQTVSSQYPQNLANSTAGPQLVPGFSQSLASTGGDVDRHMSSKYGQNNPLNANITNQARGFAHTDHSYSTPAQDGSIQSFQNLGVIANSENVENMASMLSSKQNVGSNSTFRPILPHENSMQTTQNRNLIANSENSAHEPSNVHNVHDNSTVSLTQYNSNPLAGNLNNIGNAANSDYSHSGIANNQNNRGNLTFPKDESIGTPQNPYNNANSGTYSNFGPQNSDIPYTHGHPSGTHPEHGTCLPSQYANRNTDPLQMMGHDGSRLSRPLQQNPSEPQYDSNSRNALGDMGNASTNLSRQSTQPHVEGTTTGEQATNPWSHQSQNPEAMRLERSLVRPELASSSDILGDSMPRSAHIIQQSNIIDNELASQLELLSAQEQSVESHLNCKHCGEVLVAGDVAVFADRAGTNTAWHPKCFVCNTCDELLVDLIYFFSKGNVYCGRHFAELLNIPRCYACDELIFVKEYTVAEGKTFHVKHFCCYECDDPLAGKQYIPVDDQPTCLNCYEELFGKRCHTCRKKIAAGHQRIAWKDLNWHQESDCFRCFGCSKSLLGGRFVMNEQQPFCNKVCVDLISAGKQQV